jgi:hypothetical protein
LIQPRAQVRGQSVHEVLDPPVLSEVMRQSGTSAEEAARNEEQ